MRQNGLDLEVDSRAAYEFMMSSIVKGELRFAQVLKWIDAHLTET